MTTVDSKTTRIDKLRELAVKGLGLETPPALDRDSLVAGRLFALNRAIRRRLRALELLRDTFETTPPELISPEDGRIYERELERRRRSLAEMKRERDELLVLYGEELMQSSRLPQSLWALAEAARIG